MAKYKPVIFLSRDFFQVVKGRNRIHVQIDESGEHADVNCISIHDFTSRAMNSENLIGRIYFEYKQTSGFTFAVWLKGKAKSDPESVRIMAIILDEFIQAERGGIGIEALEQYLLRNTIRDGWEFTPSGRHDRYDLCAVYTASPAHQFVNLKYVSEMKTWRFSTGDRMLDPECGLDLLNMIRTLERQFPIVRV